MSDPMRVLCRTCGQAAYGPDGVYNKELQGWYDIRHALSDVRSNWPGYSDSPAIDRDMDNELTGFLCEHKDHDLCMTEPYDHKKISEFDKSKDKKEFPQVKRCFRELVSKFHLSGDILEVDMAPRLHYSLVKPRRLQSYESGLEGQVPQEPTRFIFKREELALLRVYEEEE